MVKPRSWVSWLYCAPAIVAMLCVAGYPLARTLALALTDTRLGRWSEASFVGLQNFAYLFADPDWWRSVLNTFSITFVAVSLEASLGVIVALTLHRRFFGRGAMRTAMLVPWVIPTVVSARIWAWMFNDLYGVVNEVLLRLGWIRDRVSWLSDPLLSMGVVIWVDVWKTTPFIAILVLAALQGVPREVIEAAVLDGVSPWRRFWHVTLPLIRPGLAVAVIFRMLDSLRIFDLPYVLTSNSRATAVMSMYARQQMIDYQDTGYGSAAAFLVFTVVGCAAAIYLALGGGAER